jgi:hypothetical protein
VRLSRKGYLEKGDELYSRGGDQRHYNFVGSHRSLQARPLPPPDKAPSVIAGAARRFPLLRGLHDNGRADGSTEDRCGWRRQTRVQRWQSQIDVFR